MPGIVRVRMLDNGYRVDVEAVQGALTWVAARLRRAAARDPDPGGRADIGATRAAHAHRPGSEHHTARHPHAAADRPAVPAGAAARAPAGSCGSTTRPHSHLRALGPRRVTPQAALDRRLGGRAAAAAAVRHRRPPHHLARLVDLPRPLGALGLDGFAIDGARSTPCSRSTPPTTARRWTSTCGASRRCRRRSRPRRCRRRPSQPARSPSKRAGRVLMPTPADQNWTGWTKESEGPDGRWGLDLEAAVDATSGQVVADRPRTGALIDAFYSSSMGGHTEDERYVWGVEASSCAPSTTRPGTRRPATRPRSGPGRSASAGPRSPASSGSRASAPSRCRRAVPTAAPPASRSSGIKAGAPHHGRTSTGGTSARRSACCRRASRSRCGAPAGRPRAPLVGDWDGDGDDDPGWWRNGQVALPHDQYGGQLGQAVPVRHCGRRAGGRRLGRRRSTTTSACSAPAPGCCAPASPAAPRPRRSASAAPATCRWPAPGAARTPASVSAVAGPGCCGARPPAARRPGRSASAGSATSRSSARGTAGGATASVSSATVSGCSVTDGRRAGRCRRRVRRTRRHLAPGRRRLGRRRRRHPGRPAPHRLRAAFRHCRRRDDAHGHVPRVSRLDAAYASSVGHSTPQSPSTRK